VEKRGADIHPGMRDSERRARTFAALERALADVRFPVSKADLLREKGDVPLDLGARRSGPVPLRALLKNLNAEVFTSPAHVTEVAKINWQDFADVFTLGAGETRPPDLAKRDAPAGDDPGLASKR
jgi:hypothetical protein